VHFISPQTARLEAQAEGLNLLNLLASQWGVLFTNIGDITGELSGVSQVHTLIWVGTENRQHLLGTGVCWEPKADLCSRCAPALPERAASATHLDQRGRMVRRLPAARWGVVIRHFSGPCCEAVADIVLVKIDGVEIHDFGPTLSDFSTMEWLPLHELRPPCSSLARHRLDVGRGACGWSPQLRPPG
jgi:hypothetical protein